MFKGFRDFLMRGNVVDMAVGLVIGAAFTALVTGFVSAFLTPLIGLATASVGDFSKKTISVGDTSFPIGTFLNALLAFLLTAAVLYFLVVVPMGRLQKRFTADKPEDPKEVLRDCPECYSEIPAIATRCRACTAVVAPELPEGAVPEQTGPAQAGASEAGASGAGAGA